MGSLELNSRRRARERQEEELSRKGKGQKAFGDGGSEGQVSNGSVRASERKSVGGRWADDGGAGSGARGGPRETR
jgi:hypothetical protein